VKQLEAAARFSSLFSRLTVIRKNGRPFVPMARFDLLPRALSPILRKERILRIVEIIAILRAADEGHSSLIITEDSVLRADLSLDRFE
jgi:hypothetical protein